VASAQVKTAILFAGLNAAGKTTVREPRLSRDHTERMLPAFGCPVGQKTAHEVMVEGPVQLAGAEVRVPGDFSSAAFFLVLGLIKPQSALLIKGVCVNPTRTGLIAVLKRMGADIIVSNQTMWGGEPVGDITARHQPLTATTIDADEIPALIDEIPVLAVAAAYAKGTTVIRGAGELKHKESNRLAAIADGLNRLGAFVEAADDGLIITGRDSLRGDARVDSYDDHRIAMSLAVAALQAKNAVEILRPQCVDISFPGFWEMLSAYAS
jgi:3-phosphoshikimate 1-carboxyvinyltransferase